MQPNHGALARSYGYPPLNRPDQFHRFLGLFRLLLIWLALGWLLGGCASTPAYPVKLIATECPLPVPDELEEGRSITCGDLDVPQDRADPSGLQVRLPYARIRAESAHPSPDPLVFIAGGPGGSALAAFDQIYPLFRTLRRDRDLILYDQRGTLLADPALECKQDEPPATPTDIGVEISATAATIPAYLRPLDASDVAIAHCAAHLQAEGIKLADYDTATNARDLLDLVEALGYQQYDLYGESYGTRIALEVMRLAPPGLRAVVLDSTDPPQVNAYEYPHSLATLEALSKAFAQCAEDSACNSAYPDLATRFDHVVSQLNRQPLSLSLSQQPSFNGNDLVELLLTQLDSDLLPYLPRLIDELERGDSETLEAILGGDLPPPPPLPPTPIDPAFSGANEAQVTPFVLALNGAFLNQKLHLNDEAIREWQQLTTRNADRGRLQAFIEKYLPSELAESLLAQIAQLSEADLALAIAELRTVPPYPLTRGANLAVECRDEVPFNDYFTAITAYQRAGLAHNFLANQVVEAEDQEMRHLWAQCALFPTGRAAATQNDAVTSSVPALIFQGGLDTITPPSWAESARRTLPNSFYLEFPGQGHGVIQQPLSASSGCPAEIVLSFLNAPGQAPDAECINAAYQIPWLLPN